MQYKNCLILFHFIIIFKQYRFVGAKALKGYNIRSVDRGHYTYVVAIADMNGDTPGEECILCTGALVTLSHIVTAEHCFDDLEDDIFHVIAGSHRLSANQRYSVNWWITYDQWTDTLGVERIMPSSDIAMIKLIEDIRTRITVASLSSVDVASLPANTEVVIVGWGDVNNDRRPEKMKVAKLKYITSSVCQTTVASVLNDTILIPEEYMCSKADPHVLISYGDSGAPLLYQDEIIGVSRGVLPDDAEIIHPDTFNIHLKIRRYTEFIEEVSKCNLFIIGKALMGQNTRNVEANELTFIVAFVDVTNMTILEDCIICTGSLISKYHVLTAAHCLDPIEDMGFGILAESNILRYNMLHYPCWSITYQQWSTIFGIDVPNRHDIAIVKLIQSVGQHVIPVRISTINTSNDTLLGQPILLSGWGDNNNNEAPEILLAAVLKVISQAECSHFATEVVGFEMQISSSYVCTKAQPLIRTAGGDSGGPVLYRNKIIAINRGTFPLPDGSKAVNFHICVYAYYLFINLMLEA